MKLNFAMDIKNKLLLIIIFIVLTIVIISLLTYFTFTKFSEIYDFSNISTEALNSMRNVNDSINDLLMEQSTIDDVYSKWETRVEDYTNKFHAFLSSDTLKNFQKNKNLSPKIKSILDYYNQSIIRIDSINDEYKRLKTLNILAKSGFYIEYHINNNSNFEQLTNLALDQTKFFSTGFNEDLIDLLTLLYKESKSLESKIFIFYLTFILIISGSVIFYIVNFSKNLRKRITSQEESLEEIANGNLTKHLEIQGNDEITKISMHINNLIDYFSSVINEIKKMIYDNIHIKEEATSASSKSSTALIQITSNLEEVIKQITILNSNITSTTSDVSKITESLSSLTKEIENQFSSVTESSSSIEEMVATINNISMVSKAKKDSSIKLLDVTKNGGEFIHKTNEIVRKISDNANDVLEIITMIDEIASSTNLLSMNAAIEASHAGEMGKGFSVVADEVRKLAESTNENSKRIAEILTTIIDMAKSSLTLSNQSNQSFKNITEEVNGFTNALSEISASMEELSLGSGEVLKAILNLSETAKIVKDNSDQIERNAYSINESIKNSNNISYSVEKGMKEIESGSKEINKAMVYLNDLNKKSTQHLEILNKVVNRFKTV